MQCHDFLHLLKFINEDARQVIPKYSSILNLSEIDEQEILDINLTLESQRLSLLDKTNYAMYLFSVLDTIRELLNSNKTNMVGY